MAQPDGQVPKLIGACLKGFIEVLVVVDKLEDKDVLFEPHINLILLEDGNKVVKRVEPNGNRRVVIIYVVYAVDDEVVE